MNEKITTDFFILFKSSVVLYFMFKSDTYIKRRKELKSIIGSGIILFPGNEESSMNFADNTYHFRQDSSFLYYFGLNQPSLTGLIDIDSDSDYIFGDDLSIDHIVWMGIQPTIKEQSETVGVYETGTMREVHSFIDSALKQKRTIHYLPPYRPENQIKLRNFFNIDFDDIDAGASVDLIKAVVSMREIKSTEELIEIEKAVNTSVDMHIAAMKMVAPGILESHVAARVHEIALSPGGHLSFPVIATIHGETLHNHFHGNQLKEGQLFLLDCGAETAMGYAGDLSSTIPVSRDFTSRQREIYDLTLLAHNTAVSSLKPGKSFIDVYFDTARVIVNGLKDLDLMKGDTEEAVQLGAHAMFFPCGLGHQMGLDVHDMEDLGEEYVGYDGKAKSKQFGLKSLRLGKTLKSGMVLTIEPGIYFIPTLIDLWKSEKKFRDFINYEKLETYRDFGGIRNEENFLIIDSSYSLIGKKKPKTIEEIGNIRE